MAFYWTCPHCGANLDHGEKCDCLEQEDTNRRYHRHNKKFMRSLEDMANGEYDIERENYMCAYGN